MSVSSSVMTKILGKFPIQEVLKIGRHLFVSVVGGGITSAASTAFLTEKLGGRAEISVWDKARGLGGRMSTSRSNSNKECTADLGAQYISLRPEFEQSHK